MNKVERPVENQLPTGKLEPEFLEGLINKYAHKDPRVVIGPGIGRDATVIDFGKNYLVAKTDPITFATDEIGWYAVHVNANDVAVMGADPRWFLATLLLPEEDSSPTMVEEIFRQVYQACQDLEISLCGGHTEVTYGLDRPIVIGQMLAEMKKGALIDPKRAKPGDNIILTKSIAIEGTSIIARERSDLFSDLQPEVMERSRAFIHKPGISVVKDARTAAKVANVRAMHDPTEGGLATGLQELAFASDLGLMVKEESISILSETTIFCNKLGLDPLGLIASGALLIAAAPDDTGKIIDALVNEGIEASVIGGLRPKEEGIQIQRVDGAIDDLPSFPQDEITKLF
jgi:hydrogenase maturation factor